VLLFARRLVVATIEHCMAARSFEANLPRDSGGFPNGRFWHKLDHLLGGTFRARQPMLFGTFLTQLRHRQPSCYGAQYSVQSTCSKGRGNEAA
jgi:hypothetical protein